MRSYARRKSARRIEVPNDTLVVELEKALETLPASGEVEYNDWLAQLRGAGHYRIAQKGYSFLREQGVRFRVTVDESGKRLFVSRGE